MRDLKLDQLKTFATVVRLGSFSAAAETLSLSQPAVSLQVRELERRLGVRLIERVGRRAMPTVVGSRLIDHANRIEASVSAALDEVAMFAEGTRGRVRIGTGATACIYLLPSALKQLRQRFPDLEIVVKTGNTSDILKSLEANAVDIGLVTLPVRGRIFDVSPVLRDRFVAIAGEGAEPLPTRVTAATLGDRPLILYEPSGQSRSLIDAWFARAGVVPSPIMELGSVDAIKELVSAGLGYAVLPGVAMNGARSDKTLVTRPLSPTLDRQLGVVMRRDKVLTKTLRAVATALQQIGKNRAGRSR
ncbi:LysR family transcriptional regulator [Bauldia sp.]|uniref:LysR family transcriptional regulator n=1 Tax=Bauldia sp. TaxID=2575872 RepID=UPI003BAB0ABD